MVQRSFLNNSKKSDVIIIYLNEDYTLEEVATSLENNDPGEGKEVINRILDADPVVAKHLDLIQERVGVKLSDFDFGVDFNIDLQSFIKLDISGLDLSNKEISQLVHQLRNLSSVKFVYQARYGSDPTVQPDDDILYHAQDYHLDAPIGIGSKWAWERTNGKGARYIDIEQGWQLDHEDLPQPVNLLAGSNRYNPPNDNGDHGTATLGVISGIDNTLGGVGIASGSELIGVISHHGRLPILALLDSFIHLRPGDILLLEMEIDGLPVDTDFLMIILIRLLTAYGVIVIEAAGNRNYNLDHFSDPLFGQYLNKDSFLYFDSGAIMVGGATSDVHHNRYRSNFGTRVDCFAYSENVATSGYGYLPLPGTARYTHLWGGTSAASAIVTGAALLVQSYYKKLYQDFGQPSDLDPHVSPKLMRQLLSGYGTPQGPSIHGNIGVMPDLRQIFYTLDMMFAYS